MIISFATDHLIIVSFRYTKAPHARWVVYLCVHDSPRYRTLPLAATFGARAESVPRGRTCAGKYRGEIAPNEGCSFPLSADYKPTCKSFHPPLPKNKTISTLLLYCTCFNMRIHSVKSQPVRRRTISAKNHADLRRHYSERWDLTFVLRREDGLSYT